MPPNIMASPDAHRRWMTGDAQRELGAMPTRLNDFYGESKLAPLPGRTSLGQETSQLYVATQDVTSNRGLKCPTLWPQTLFCQAWRIGAFFLQRIATPISIAPGLRQRSFPQVVLPLGKVKGGRSRFRDFRLELLCHQLIPNHIHLVHRTLADGELRRYMKWVCGTRTMRYHARNHTGDYGQVYQQRFKSFPIHSDEHLSFVGRYVERNVVRARLVDRSEKWRLGFLWHWI